MSLKHQIIKFEDTPIGKALSWVTIDKPLQESKIEGKTYSHNIELVEYVQGSDNAIVEYDEKIVKDAIHDFMMKMKLMVEEKDILYVSTGGIHVVMCPPLTPDNRYVIHVSVLGSVTQEVIDFKYNLKKRW